MDRLMVKWDTAAELVPQPVLRKASSNTPFGVIAYGSSDGAVNEALDRLAEQGIHADYLRVAQAPFARKISPFAKGLQQILLSTFQQWDNDQPEGGGTSNLISYLTGRGRAGQRRRHGGHRVVRARRLRG